MSARFKIKRTAPASWALRDRARPAFLHTASSHDGALRAMDNVIRREKGLAPRIVWPTDNGPHDGRHVQGCIACYEATAEATS
jgi:hypothetical protein